MTVPRVGRCRGMTVRERIRIWPYTVPDRGLSRRRGCCGHLPDDVLEVLAVQGGHAVAVFGEGADALQDLGSLLDEGPYAWGEVGVTRELAAQAKGKAGGEGDHDGRVIGHAGELSFALDGSAHHVECRGEACCMEEVTDLCRSGWMVDYTAVNG